MNHEKETEMREAFREQAGEVLAEPDRFRKDAENIRVGLELEVAVHHPTASVETLTGHRDAILADHPEFTDVELGATQVEIRTPPVDLSTVDGVSPLRTLSEDRFGQVLESARRREVQILRIGANPFLPTIGAPRTDKPKYRLVPDFYNRNRNPSVDTVIGNGAGRVDVGDAAVVSLFQALHINLEARSLEDAVDKMNRSFGIAPFLLAISGNARYLNGGVDTAMEDVRFTSWERSHDTRVCDTSLQDMRMPVWQRSFDVRPPASGSWGDNEPRVGLPGRYFRDISDYLERAGMFPFILDSPDAALAISIGMTWLDTRVKFVEDSAVVELRLLSTQPTIAEEIMLLLLYLGRLHLAQENDEPFLPMEKVSENRLAAMTCGVEGSMWVLDGCGGEVKVPAREAIGLELDRAKDGLERLGLSGSLDETLLSYVLRAGSPSTRLDRILCEHEGNVTRRAMEYLLDMDKVLL